MFKEYGLRLNLKKTEVFSVGQQRENLHSRMEKFKQWDHGFVHLCRLVTDDGRSELRVCRWTQAGAMHGRR